MPLDFNYHHLYYFFSIAKSGSIANAGDELSLSPAALSKQLSLFERATKRKLFDRRAGRLFLTDDGRVFYDFARRIFTLGDQLANQIRSRGPLGTPALRLGVSPGAEPYAEALIEWLLRRHPDAEILTVVETNEALMPKVADLRLDLLVSCQRAISAHGAHVQVKLVCRAPIHFVSRAKRSHPDDRPTFVMPPLSPEMDREVRNLLELLHSKMIVQVPSAAAALRLAGRGFGVAIIDGLSLRRHHGPHVVTDRKMKGRVIQEVFLASSQREATNPLAREAMAHFSVGKGR